MELLRSLSMWASESLGLTHSRASGPGAGSAPPTPPLPVSLLLPFKGGKIYMLNLPS